MLDAAETEEKKKQSNRQKTRPPFVLEDAGRKTFSVKRNGRGRGGLPTFHILRTITELRGSALAGVLRDAANDAEKSWPPTAAAPSSTSSRDTASVPRAATNHGRSASKPQRKICSGAYDFIITQSGMAPRFRTNGKHQLCTPFPNLQVKSETRTICGLFPMEKIVCTRLSTYIEKQGLFSPTMFCFRAHLSTQDVLLQLKREVIDPPHGEHGDRTILTPDLKGAFDNVKPSKILSNLNSTNCGHKNFLYIQDFLQGMKA